VDQDSVEWELNLAALRKQVREENFAIRPHAMQHAVKEGFTGRDMIAVVLLGSVIEVYPTRRRCLICANVTIEGLEMSLHVLCEHLWSDGPVDFVTAYIPSEELWETPTRRRKIAKA